MNYFFPDIYTKSIYTINYNMLLENGIRCLLFDLENTCVPYKCVEPTSELKELFDKLKDMGFKIIIFSNSSKEKLDPFKDYLNVDCSSKSRKPFKKKFLKVLKVYKYKLSEVAIVGDQLVLDIYGGNRVGITTILVNSMSKYDAFYVSFLRAIERFEIKRMGKRGIFKIGEYYE